MAAHTGRTIVSRVLLLLSLVIFQSCHKNMAVSDEKQAISFSMMNDWYEQDRCYEDFPQQSENRQQCRLEIEGTPLSISLSEYDMQETLYTKGVPITTENIESFYVYSYLEDGTIYMEEQFVERNGNSWEYYPVKYWPDTTLDFFAYSISKFNESFVRNVKCSIDPIKDEYIFSFYYSLPASDIYQSIDAENQSDMVVAIKEDCSKEQGTVELTFKHILSSILFQTGDIPDGTVRINYIELSNLYGRCNISMFYSPTEGYNYSWNYVGQPYETYSQSFLDIDGDGGNDNVKDNQLLTQDPWKTFMMIPQEFTEEAMINVSMSINGYNQPILSIPLSLLHQNNRWEPGKRYIYTINYNG